MREAMRNSSLLLGVACSFLLASTVGAQEPERALADPGPGEHLLYGVADVQWQDGPASFEAGSRVAILEGDPGAPGVFTMRIKMPDGFRIAPHWHPNVERVTVLSGTFRLGSGDVLDPNATTAMGPGSYTSMPPGMRHFAIAEGETVIQLTSVGPWVIHYVDPDDDPRR
jgi:quercetin dioxygenase-like cupin family protein